MRHPDAPKRKKMPTAGHTVRLFCLYFVTFGTILAFVGLIGGDSLPGSGWFIWALLAVALILAIIATVSHVRSGGKTPVDELADKW